MGKANRELRPEELRKQEMRKKIKETVNTGLLVEVVVGLNGNQESHIGFLTNQCYRYPGQLAVHTQRGKTMLLNKDEIMSISPTNKKGRPSH